MKIKLDKGQKIELLKAVKLGILDTNKIPELVSQIANIDPFLELMQSASLIDEDKEVINQ